MRDGGWRDKGIFRGGEAPHAFYSSCAGAECDLLNLGELNQLHSRGNRKKQA